MIIQVENNKEKEMISRTILEALPDWFGIPEAREEYIVNSVNQQLFAAVKEEKTIGFLCLKQTGKDTVEVSVMGVLKEFHRHGKGRKLFMKAREKAIKDGFSFIQVKPFRWVSMIIMTIQINFI